MKQVVLLILAALVAAVFAQLPAGMKDGQTFTVQPEVVKDPEQVGNSFKAEECAQVREVTCQYLKKCSKLAAENECLKWQPEQVCVQEKIEEYKETKEICAQLETFDRFQPDKCYKCLKKGTEEVPAKRTVCAKYETQQKCLERGPRPLCAEYQLVKHCYEVNPPYDVEGPKTCAANQEIFYTLTNQGAGERALLTRQCRPVVSGLKMSQCSGALDPHMTSVTGQAFEFQHAGDFKFLITSDGAFECHVRYQHIVPGASWSGPSAFACRVNGVDTIVWDQDSYRINGHPVVLALNAAQNFPEGGSVTLQNNGQRVLIKSPNRAVFFMDFTFTQVNGNTKTISGNTYGQIPSDLTVSGLCAGGDANKINYWLNDRAYGLFPFTYEAKVEGSAYPTPSFTDAEKQVAEAKCTTVWDKKSQPTQFSNCVFDFLNAGWANRQAVLESEKDVVSQNINAAATVQK